MLATPPAPTFTIPENKATVRVGTTARQRPPKLSPPSSSDPDRALVGADQAAVIVAHKHAQPALAEIIIGRIGRFVIGELQDAFIHRRQGDIGVFAAAEAFQCHRNRDALARQDLVAAADRHIQRARSIIDAQPSHADGPYRLAPGDACASGRYAVTST